MQAVVYERYGPPEVLQLREVPKPLPGNDEVLIRIRAVAVNKGDCEMRRPEIPNSIWFVVRLFFGLFRPRKRILGAYFAGDVEAVGKNVRRFRPGDSVLAASGARFGAYAEYISLPAEASIAVKPDNITYEEAAAVPLGGTNALHYLRAAEIRPGEKVLVNGAGGAFGTFAVQLAKGMGAEVTGVDSAVKLEMIRDLGADHVIDYTREDFAESGRTYDVFFDVLTAPSLSRGLKVLNRGGRYLLTNPAGFPQLIRAGWASLTGNRTIVTEMAKETPEELSELCRLIEEGSLRSVIDRSYPMDQVVAAHHYVESGAKLGNVVLTIPHPS